MRYKTHNDLAEDALNKGLELLDTFKYENSNSYSKNKYHFKCIECGKISYITPHSIDVKIGFGCRSCSAKKSQETFIKEMFKVNPDIEILGNYKSSKTKILCKCKVCEFEWERIPNDLLRGFGCPKCNNHIYYSPEQFKEDFYAINNKIELITNFKNHNTPILCKCRIDGYQWYAYPYDLMNEKSSCKKCNNNIPYTKNILQEKLYKINANITVIGEVYNNKTPIEVSCDLCGHHWNARPNNLISSRTGCPICNKSKYKIEEAVRNYLDKNNIHYIYDMRFNDLRGVGGKPLSYDFYLDNNNKLIECQGIQHSKPVKYFGGEERFKIQQEHDIRKKNYAANNNYELIEIYKADIKNIDNKLNSLLAI